jgi:ABC-type spermidine/putrescine transport system permease subunit II
MRSRKYFWLILVMCVLSTAATLLQLLAVYVLSFVEVPKAYHHFNSFVAGATDIRSLKAACLSLAHWDEMEQQGRVKLMIYSPFIALLTSIVCAALAVQALVTNRKANQRK